MKNLSKITLADIADQTRYDESLRMPPIILCQYQILSDTGNESEILIGLTTLRACLFEFKLTRESLMPDIYKKMCELVRQNNNLKIKDLSYQVIEDLCSSDKTFIHPFWKEQLFKDIHKIIQKTQPEIPLSSPLHILALMAQWTTKSGEILIRETILDDLFALIMRENLSQLDIVAALDVIASLVSVKSFADKDLLLSVIDHCSRLVAAPVINFVQRVFKIMSCAISKLEPEIDVQNCNGIIQIGLERLSDASPELALDIADFLSNATFHSDAYANQLVTSGFFDIAREIISRGCFHDQTVVKVIAEIFTIITNILISVEECAEPLIVSPLMNYIHDMIIESPIILKTQIIHVLFILVSQCKKLEALIDKYPDLLTEIGDILAIENEALQLQILEIYLNASEYDDAHSTRFVEELMHDDLIRSTIENLQSSPELEINNAANSLIDKYPL